MSSASLIFPKPLPLSLGGTNADLVGAGLDYFLSLYSGNDTVTLTEIDPNFGSSSPSFSDVNTIRINSLPAPSEGIYTPTYTNVANVASFGTVSDLSWFRTGNRVTVFGRVSIDPTAASVN